jgi:hypothetical protein
MPLPRSSNWKELTRTDMIMIRRAIREGWPVPRDGVTLPILEGLYRDLKSRSRSHRIAAARTLSAMVEPADEC